MATIGSLSIALAAQTAGLASGMRSAIGIARSFAGALEGPLAAGAGGALGSMASTAGALLGPVAALAAPLAAVGAGLAAIGAATAYGVSLYADFESAALALEVMTGSADRAKTMMADLTRFAAETPFESPELLQTTKLLLGMGISADSVMPSLRMIGDVASGLGQPIGEVAYLFGQVKSQGRLMGDDLRQFASRGVPIYESLAQVMGVNKEAVRELVSSGKVGFPELESAFALMSGEGGRFFNMMARQSQTLHGLWSTLKDAMNLIFLDLGEAVTEGLDLRGGLKGIIGFVESIRAPLKSTFVEIVTYLRPAVDAIRDFGVHLLPIAKAAAAALGANLRTGLTVALMTARSLWAVIEPLANKFAQWLGYASSTDALQSGMMAVRDAILTAFIAAEFFARNFERFAVLARDIAELASLGIKGEFGALFDTALTGMLTSFHQRFLGFLTSLVTNAGIAAKAVANVWLQFKKAQLGIAAGEVGAGAAAAIAAIGAGEKLPFADLVLGQDQANQAAGRAAELRESIRRQLGELGRDFEAFRQKRMAELLGNPWDELDVGLDQAMAAPQELAGAFAKAPWAELDMGLDAAMAAAQVGAIAGDLADQVQDKLPAAFEFGGKDALSAIAKFEARGIDFDKPKDKVASIAEKMLEVEKDQQKELKEIRKKVGPPRVVKF